GDRALQIAVRDHYLSYGKTAAISGHRAARTTCGCINHRVFRDCCPETTRRARVSHHSAITANLSDQALSHDSLESSGKLATVHAEVGETSDRAAGIVGVECCEYKVPGKGCLDRNRRSLA